MQISIRRAIAREAPLLSEIAHAAKRHWRYPERWIELWHEQLTVTESFVATHEVFVAEHDGAAIGFYALIPSASECALDHLWVRPEWIGIGVGRALFEHAVTRAAACRAEHIEVDSDPHAEGFYMRMGARRIGETAAHVDGHQRVLPRLRLDLPAGI
jgi:GNAT superfamily N-acetyltransferase